MSLIFSQRQLSCDQFAGVVDCERTLLTLIPTSIRTVCLSFQVLILTILTGITSDNKCFVLLQLDEETFKIKLEPTTIFRTTEKKIFASATQTTVLYWIQWNREQRNKKQNKTKNKIRKKRNSLIEMRLRF